MVAFTQYFLTSLTLTLSLPAAESGSCTATTAQKIVPEDSANRQEHHLQQRITSPHCRSHPPPLLPRLPPQRLRRLHPRLLHPLQQGRARRRHQSLPPRRRLRCRCSRQDCPRASLPQHRLLRRHPRRRHP
ncbi:hypothetical protein GBA52_011959 [Prunus armeniaca]|nr:hypothetical protein GBA52_011959 [Prunus armeniaca]